MGYIRVNSCLDTSPLKRNSSATMGSFRDSHIDKSQALNPVLHPAIDTTLFVRLKGGTEGEMAQDVDKR